MGSPLEALEAQARSMESERNWSAAAGAWASIADTLGRGGDAGRAAQAWDAAGEAWRRDDQPALADKALKSALLLTEDAGLATIVRVKRSGCLAALGQLEEARQVLHQAMLGPAHAQPVVADGLVDLSLAVGDAGSAARWAQRITGDNPLVQATRSFRAAQCHRLNAELDLAESALESASSALPGLAGKAALCSERAELAEARGDANGALGLRREAMALHDEERRRGPWWSALAALVRTASLAQVTLPSVPHAGDEQRPEEAVRSALVAAHARGLVLVGLDLAVANALLARDGRALSRACSDARDLGARLRAGRGLLCGVALGIVPPDNLEIAEQDVSGAPLWLHRVRALAGDGDSRAWLEQRGVQPFGS